MKSIVNDMRPNKIEIKICGLRERQDVLRCLDLDVDYCGFILYEKSPRGLSAPDLCKLVDSINRSFRAVGVFVNADRNFVEQVARDCGLSAVQLHGDEHPEEFQDMPVEVWRAVWLQDGLCSPQPERWKANRLVIDSALPGLYGGTGVPADWPAVAELARQYRIMLAGGLTPQNVAVALQTVRPLGVDVSSGVETRPGKKDPEKLKEFVKAVRGWYDYDR